MQVQFCSVVKRNRYLDISTWTFLEADLFWNKPQWPLAKKIIVGFFGTLMLA